MCRTLLDLPVVIHPMSHLPISPSSLANLNRSAGFPVSPVKSQQALHGCQSCCQMHQLELFVASRKQFSRLTLLSAPIPIRIVLLLMLGRNKHLQD